MRMYAYTVRRLLLFVPILFGVSILIFMIMHIVPGSPARTMLGSRATPELIAELERELGLNRPLPAQYIGWVTGVLTGNLGHSYTYDRPVSAILVGRFLVTFKIVISTIICTVLIAVPVGVIGALNRDSLADYTTIGIGILGVSVPTFFSGILLMEFFAVRIPVFPISGHVPLTENPIESIRHLVLPVATLTIVGVAVTVRMMRSSMLEVIQEDFIRFLKAKGLSNRTVIFGHALKNSFIPVITIIGLQFGYLLSGTIVIEQIYAIPGLGRTIVQATLERDYPLIQGSVLLMALWFATVNLLTDLIVAYLDPQILANE